MTLKFYTTSSSSTKKGFGGFYIVTCIHIRLILYGVILIYVGTMNNVTSPSKLNRVLTIKSSTSKVLGKISSTISTEFNLRKGGQTKELGY